jgi:hypothetical protein
MELQMIVFIGEMPYLQEMPLALFNPQWNYTIVNNKKSSMELQMIFFSWWNIIFTDNNIDGIK